MRPTRKSLEFINPNFLGHSIAEVSGEAAFQVLHPFLLKALVGEEQKFLREVPYKIGPKFIEAHYIPDRSSDGTVRGVVVVATDRTDIIKQEQVLKNERAKSLQNDKLATLGSMLACIVHEINNPLTVIASSASLMEKYKLNPEAIDSKLAVIKRSTERIAKIIKSLTRYTRASNDSVLVEENLCDIVKESLVLIHAKAKKNNTTIQLNETSFLDAKISCDQIEIEQVLINLVNNSIDAIRDLPERWIHISVHQDSTAIVMEIEDSGPGIPTEIEHKLFAPFFTTKPLGEGTGLGLSIVKVILERHKATIALKKGTKHTTFEIRFLKEVTSYAA